MWTLGERRKEAAFVFHLRKSHSLTKHTEIVSLQVEPSEDMPLSRMELRERNDGIEQSCRSLETR